MVFNFVGGIGMLISNVYYYQFSCMVGTEGTSAAVPTKRLSWWP